MRPTDKDASEPLANPRPTAVSPSSNQPTATLVTDSCLLARALGSTYLGQKLESKHPASDASARATVGDQTLITGLASPPPSSIPLCTVVRIKPLTPRLEPSLPFICSVASLEPG